MWVGAVDRRYSTWRWKAARRCYLGEFRKELLFGLRRNYQLGRQLMTPTFTDPTGDRIGATVRHRTEMSSTPPLLERRLGFWASSAHSMPAGSLALGLSGHAWHEPGQDQSTLGVGAQAIKAGRSGEQVLGIDLIWTGVYHRAAFDGEFSIRTGALRLAPRLRAGWGEQLPAPGHLPPGRGRRFSGASLGERRGDREFVLSTLLTYALKGPFVGRMELAAGRSAFGGGLLASDGWLAGVRAGLGAETPVGPLRFEYGLTQEGREAVFVRLGRWF